jgi:REP element-mobilizing transposase RayT
MWKRDLRTKQLEIALVRAPRKKRPARRGRPPKSGRASEWHKERPVHNPRNPAHVTCRIVDGIRSLRTRDMYHAIRWATLTAARREDFRIVHLSIQRNHLHLIVEADDKRALARGMQGFAISAAKLINSALLDRRGRRRTGTVFPDRYHLRVLKTPTEARHAIAYVMNNWRRHREDEGRSWNVDPFASGVFFEGWHECEHQIWAMKPPPTYEPLIVWRPRTWLLKGGWLRGGPPISFREVPGRR